jgi:hypothetical protein
MENINTTEIFKQIQDIEDNIEEDNIEEDEIEEVNIKKNNIDDDEDIDDDDINDDDNMSRYKLLSSLFGMNMGINMGMNTDSAADIKMNNMCMDCNNTEENDVLLLITNKIENISTTNDLIYEETCAITISNESIKDEIENIKNKISEFQSDISDIKKKIDLLINNISKLNI